MKINYTYILVFFITSLSFGQISESFDTGLTSGSFTTGDVNLTSGTWETVSVRAEQNPNRVRTGASAARLDRNRTPDASLTTPTLIGAGTVSFWYRKFKNQDAPGTIALQVSTNGSTYTTVATADYTLRTYTQFVYTINNPSNLTIRILNERDNGRVIIDDFEVTAFINDDLANATPISCGNTYTGDTSSATLDEDNAPDVATIETDTAADTDSPNVWYSFIGTGDVVTLSTCANTNFDSEILVFTGSSGNLTLIDDGYDECNNTTYEAETSFTSVLGTQYLISIDGYLGDSGTFELVVDCPIQPSVIYTFNGTWDNDPNGVATSNDDIIILSGDATISSNTVCNTTIIKPGASLTVNTNKILSVTAPIIGLTLESVSNSYSSLFVNGAVRGTINYERHVNLFTGIGGNDLVSAPLSGQSWSDFLSTGTNAADLLDDGNTSPTAYAFAPFDKTTNPAAYINFTDETATTFISGFGHRVATDAGTTLTFTGTPLSSLVKVNISISGIGAEEWNLIGNPYASYISAFDFLNHNINNNNVLNNLAGAIYGYNGVPNGSRWEIYNLASVAGAGNDVLITPGQGFYVASGVPAGFIQFTTAGTPAAPDMRRTGSSDDFINGRTEANYNLELQLSTSQNTFKTDFYFNDNSSLGLNPGYDAKLFGQSAPAFSIYSHLVEENTGIAMGIQSLSLNDLTNVNIALGVNANQGEQLIFSISETTLPDTVEIYLDDMVANTTTLLNNSDYIFTPNTEVSGTGRFFLRYNEDALSTEENGLNNLNIYTSKTTKEIIIKGQLSEDSMLNIYDIHGRLVKKTELYVGQTENRVDVSNISAGIYIVELKNINHQLTKKLVIE